MSNMRKQNKITNFGVQLQRYADRVADFGHYDEMFNKRGKPWLSSKLIYRHISRQEVTPMVELQERIEAMIETLGITFSVAGVEQDIDRAWPLDVLPRAISKKTWQVTAAGLSQRLRAINCFINDIYNEQHSIKDGVVPAELVLGSSNYLPQCCGAKPRFGAWVNICGPDLIRAPNGKLLVLEDNLRVPSGIAYMLENREVMYRVAAELFASCKVLPVENFPQQIYAMLASLSPRPGIEPNIVVLTPGTFNSAYFEHVFLAREMGVQLVENDDLTVVDDIVYLRTISGLLRVDVIYRRVDDHFLDPQALRKDSLLGVPGLFKAWKLGNVSLANAPGTGVADDKAVYAFVPQLIRYFLDEEPMLSNLPTMHMADKATRDEAFGRVEKLVFKPINASGGYGIIIGPKASKSALAQLKRKLKSKPSNYIAQEMCLLSTAPTLVKKVLEPCHVDLRPFILQAEGEDVSAGGLTRVASKPGQLIVNSSQGGGSKDTWIIDHAGRKR